VPDGDVNLTIDGRPASVPRGTLLVEAAMRLGIEIPVFCYHHKLDPVGACRLCLVDITPGPPKPQTACTTPAAEGMTVTTNSARATAARADILEYELLNHPLDCPVCDKGGECPLQDYSFRHAYPTSPIDAPRLHFKKPISLSERIALDRERCVLCYRCTRYYDEIAWEQELTVGQRGVESYITSQLDQPLQSIFSGNIIDLCPVGALTSRVWRFESRPWDMNHEPGVCSRCAVGCSVTLWERRNLLVRVTSHENPEIDDGWICDRGRFEYTHVNSPERVRVPEVAGNRASWEQALGAVADGLGRSPGAKLGIVLPRDATNEELHLLSRLLEGPWRGARVTMENRSRLPAPPPETARIRDLDRAGAIVVVGADTREVAPIVNLRIKKAARLGAAVIQVSATDVDLDRDDRVIHVRPGPEGLPAAVGELARHELLGWRPVVVLYGEGDGHGEAAEIAAAAIALAAAVDGSVMPLYRATNERGAHATRVLGSPDDLAGVETLLCWGPPPATGVPASARFVVSWDTHRRTEHSRVDVLLPAQSFAESQGSYTNLEGQVQRQRPVVQALPPLRSGWEVLSDLLLAYGLHADYRGMADVQREAAVAHPALAALAEPSIETPEPRATLLGAARP
jgi:NADH-quinone oxidoreductase subunit G